MKQMRTLRKARGLTLVQLGDIVGTNNSHLSNIENGKASPSYDLLCRLAAALGTTPAELLSPEPPAAAPGLSEPDVAAFRRQPKPMPVPAHHVVMEVRRDLWPFAMLAGDRATIDLSRSPTDGRLCYVSTGDGSGAEQGSIRRKIGDHLVDAEGRVTAAGAENCVVRGEIVQITRNMDMP